MLASITLTTLASYFEGLRMPFSRTTSICLLGITVVRAPSSYLERPFDDRLGRYCSILLPRKKCLL